MQHPGVAPVGSKLPGTGDEPKVFQAGGLRTLRIPPLDGLPGGVVRKHRSIHASYPVVAEASLTLIAPGPEAASAALLQVQCKPSALRPFSLRQ